MESSEADEVSKIREAFERLNSTITQSDAIAFRSTTLQDVRDAAVRIENKQAQRSCLRNMRRMEPVFKAIENYSKVIEVLCQGTPYLCFLWVRSATLSSRSNTDWSLSPRLPSNSCSRLVLLFERGNFCLLVAPDRPQIADDYTSSFEKLIDAYAQIAESLPRFDRLSAAFERKPEFQLVLADVYVDILEFHRRAYKFFRRSGEADLMVVIGRH
jgi:hypothetical protein